MNGRISTGMLYQQSLTSMLAKQAKLAHTQQQLSTGQKLISAKDDPVAAGLAVGLDRSLAELERYGQNANVLQNRLGLQENALARVGDAMARVSELTIQASNPAMGPDSRKAISTELEAIHAGLIDLANSTDGSGRYLFGGTADGDAPFSIGTGGVVYSGDQTQRRVELAPDTFVSDTLPGSEIFLRLRTGDGRVHASALPGNTGTGLLMDYSLTDPAAFDGGTYQVRFPTPDTYEVRNSANVVVGTGSFDDGESIAFAGLQIKLDGAPAAGDAFEIGPAGVRDVFGTIQGLIDTLESNPVTAGERTAMQNALQGALRDVSLASGRMIDARAAGGAQLRALDQAADLRDANSITVKDALSGLRDLDWAEAISRYNQETTALQAAQTVFTQMQSMSLFNMMR
jgi:flagellar hook-associated protein 3 FlgL